MHNLDMCCSIVARLDEVVIDPQVKARGLLDRKVGLSEAAVPALPLPIAPRFLSAAALSPAPQLEKCCFDTAAMGGHERQDTINIDRAF